MAVIAFNGVCKNYGAVEAVKNVSFEVQRGDIFGFLGPNGSGKTTSIAMILGLLRPTRGTVQLLGSSPIAAVRQRIGAVMENAPFYPYLTAAETLRFRALAKGHRNANIPHLLGLVDLSSAANQKVGSFSLGMRQRLGIAAAFLGTPECIVLDEPSNGLDPSGFSDLRNMMASAAGQGTTVFFSSHLLGEVEKACTQVAIIDHGTIVRSGALKQLLGDKSAFVVRATDHAALVDAIRNFPPLRTMTEEGNSVVVELNESDPAGLSSFLSRAGIVITAFGTRTKTLEEVFLHVTRDVEPSTVEQ